MFRRIPVWEVFYLGGILLEGVQDKSNPMREEFPARNPLGEIQYWKSSNGTAFNCIIFLS